MVRWQFMFLCLMTLSGWVGSLFFSPFIGLWVYYLFTVIRPQFLWEYALQDYFIGHWAFYVSMPLIASFILWTLGIISYGKNEKIEMRYRPRFTIGHMLMVAFAFWITLSYLFSTNKYVSEQWFGEYVKIMVVFVIASRVIRRPEHVKWIIIMIAVSMAYISFECFQEYAIKGYLKLYKRGFAGLDNNGAALMIAMGIPICYFCWEMDKSRFRWFYLISIPFLMYAVLTSYSRGAMLSTIAVAPLYLLFTRKRALLFLLYIAGIIFTGFAAGKEIQERFLTVKQADKDASFNSRWNTWNIAIGIANDYPFFGVGVRCSNLHTGSRGADMENRTIHSQYFQIAADSGWPALVIYGSMYAWGIFSCWQARRKLWYRNDENARQACCMLGAIECSLWTFAIGATALSLEVFELPYIMLLLGMQMSAMLNATDTMAPAVPRYKVVSTRVQSNPSQTQQQPQPQYNEQGPGWVGNRVGGAV